MTTTKQVFRVCVIIAVVILLLAYGLDNYWWVVIPVVMLGILGWVGGSAEKWSWGVNLFLAGMIILITCGAFGGLRLYLLLPVILSTLAAWDLIRFQRRIGEVAKSAGIRKMEKRHLGLLGLALGGGGIFASIVLSFQIQLTFGIALLSSVVLIIMMGQIYHLLMD